jgi:putative aldouronate transport system permease protein
VIISKHENLFMRSCGSLNISAMGSSKTKKSGFVAWLTSVRKDRPLLLMCLPAMLFFIVFAYIPMPGIYLAFTKFNYAKGIFNSQFVGLDNLKFITLSGEMWVLIRNTVLYNFAFIITGNVVMITMALLLNEIRNKWFRKISQSVMILPHFISYVLVGLFVYTFLNYDFGVLNMVRSYIGLDKIAAYSDPAIWPAIIVLVNLWKGVGYGTIVYFAALMSIDAEMLQAAEIDGASTWQKNLRVILPCLKPTVIILMLLSIGGIFAGNFGLFYNLIGGNNFALFNTTDIIDTYVYRSMVNNFQFSSASAVSLVQSILGFLIVLGTNWVVKKTEPEYSLF